MCVYMCCCLNCVELSVRDFLQRSSGFVLHYRICHRDFTFSSSTFSRTLLRYCVHFSIPLYTCFPESVSVYSQCNLLCFTSKSHVPPPPLRTPRPTSAPWRCVGSGNMGRGTQGGRTPQLERNSNEPAQSRCLFPRQQAPNK